MSLPVVLQVLPSFQTLYEARAVFFALAAKEAGNMEDSAILYGAGTPPHSLRRRNVILDRIPDLFIEKPFGHAALVSVLSDRIRFHRASLLHLHSLDLLTALHTVCQRVSCSLVISLEEEDIQKLHPRWYRKRRHRQDIEALSRVAWIVLASEFLKRRLQEFWTANGADAPLPPISVIPEAVDLDRYSPAQVTSARLIDLSTIWRLSDGVPVIVVPGALVEKGRQDFMIAALQSMKTERPLCLFIGETPEHSAAFRRKIQRLARECSVLSHIHITGPCLDMAAAFMLADAVVLTSDRTGATGFALQAQAMGKPVFCPHAETLNFTYLHDETGWRYQKDSGSTLARILDRFFSMPNSKRESLSTKAQERIRSQFALSRINKEITALYSRLSKKAGSPASDYDEAVSG